MVEFKYTPPTKKAALQKILEIQSNPGTSMVLFPEERTDDLDFSVGFKMGAMAVLIEMFNIKEEDFR